MAPAKKQKKGAPSTASGKKKKGWATQAERDERKSRPRRARAEHRAQLYRRAIEVVKELPEFSGEYTAALGDAFAVLIADGCTLDNVSSFACMPPRYMLLRWIADKEHPLSRIYYDAKALLVPLYEERAQAAADNPLRGVIVTRRQAVTKTGAVVDLREEREVDNVERSKLQVGTYQWTLSHLLPKKHGRNAQPAAGEPNDQLKALFESLKQGPAE